MSRRGYEVEQFPSLLETRGDQEMNREFVFEQKERISLRREISAGLRFVWPINCQVSKLTKTPANLIYK